MSTIEEAREQAREALANHAVNIMETDYWCDVVLAPALRALLDATEPPKPAEDEREALVMTLYANGMAGNLHEPLRRQAVQKWADAILAAGYSKGPRPITDEMVEAAAREYHERGNGEGSYARASEHVRTSLLFRMKCAFNAAEAVGS